MRFFNILDEEKALELKSKGFNYKETHFLNAKVFSFIETEELVKELNSNFAKSDYFMSNLMFL